MYYFQLYYLVKKKLNNVEIKLYQYRICNIHYFFEKHIC